ncbi:MAG: hypothetical protein ABSE59_06155 [Opitutaceae bacterium]|jgi:hypothetical protein
MNTESSFAARITWSCRGLLLVGLLLTGRAVFGQGYNPPDLSSSTLVSAPVYPSADNYDWIIYPEVNTGWYTVTPQGGIIAVTIPRDQIVVPFVWYNTVDYDNEGFPDLGPFDEGSSAYWQYAYLSIWTTNGNWVLNYVPIAWYDKTGAGPNTGPYTIAKDNYADYAMIFQLVSGKNNWNVTLNPNQPYYYDIYSSALNPSGQNTKTQKWLNTDCSAWLETDIGNESYPWFEVTYNPSAPQSSYQLPYPMLLSPGNGATVNTKTPTLLWAGANDAAQFDLQVLNSAGNVVYSTSIPTNSPLWGRNMITLPSLTVGQKYSWRMRQYLYVQTPAPGTSTGYTTYSAWSPWSASSSFTVE